MPREIAGGTSMVPPRILMRLGRGHIGATKDVWRRRVHYRHLAGIPLTQPSHAP
jgi:hypothetical protein